MLEPAEAIEVIHERFGRHPRHRALHAKGVWLRGTFTASPEARTLCRAAHLQGGEIPVLARLSNGGGNPRVPDYAPDVRGLAVKFELPDGGRTDLVSQSIPRFFSSTPEEFVDFIRANTGRAAAWRLPRFLATHPKALRSLPVNAPALRPIPSFARCRFYGVHAFRWLDADGGDRHVRSDWRPEAGEARIANPLEARKRAATTCARNCRSGSRASRCATCSTRRSPTPATASTIRQSTGPPIAAASTPARSS